MTSKTGNAEDWQRKLDFVLEDFEIGMLEWRRGEHGPAYCSPGLLDILPELERLEPDRWSLEYLLGLCDPQGAAEVSTAIAQIWEGEQITADFEVRLRLPRARAGHVVLVVTIGVIKVDPIDGRPAQALVNVTDITRERDSGEIRYSHYKKLVNDAPLGVLVLDEANQEKIAYANNAIARLLSAPESKKTITRHELRGKLLRRFVLREDRDLLASALMSGGKFTAPLDARLVRLDNLPLEVRISVARNRWVVRGGEEIRGLFLFVTDLTGINQERRELRRKTEEMEQFIYMVSHDLRNPLITISSFAGLLNKEALEKNTPKFVKNLERIRRAARHLHGLLDGLLELSRIGRQELARERLLLRDEAGHVRNALKAAIDARKVEVWIDPNLPPVFGVRTRIFQVLQNLIENAIKFMGDQRNPRIEIGFETRAGKTVFFVRDNGIGIAAGQLKAIFGLFVRLDPGSVEGYGVGLAVVQRIVEGHGGQVWAENNASADPAQSAPGSTFFFTLPPAQGKHQT